MSTTPTSALLARPSRWPSESTRRVSGAAVLAALVLASMVTFSVLLLPPLTLCPVRVIRVSKPRTCSPTPPRGKRSDTLSLWERFGTARDEPYAMRLPVGLLTELVSGAPPSLQRCVIDECLSTDPATWRPANGSKYGDPKCLAQTRTVPWSLQAPRAGAPLTCAVVGSGGVLKGSGCGSRIDGADVIFRANDPPTAGFEQDVGSRGDVQMFNRYWAQWLSRGDLDLSEYNTVSTVRKGNLTAVANGSTAPRPLTAIFRAEAHNPVEADIASWMCAPPGLSPMPFQKDWSAFRMSERWDAEVELWYKTLRGSKTGIHPTTGMIMFLLAASLCTEVHMYGFKQYNGIYHYYDPPLKHGADGGTKWAHYWHNFNDEHKLFDVFSWRGLQLNICEDKKDDR
ncbi:glycosyltransferase family 29-domain-containing protein [Pavlovales sp. CCMP2436]|nr:glycosyltransferase family 29-domain-containing protein [Pavlovales sp. CCMP2436]